MQRWRSKRGAALVEAAMVIPILLLISAGIFEFGRAYQTWQVLTNAAGTSDDESLPVQVLRRAS